MPVRWPAGARSGVPRRYRRRAPARGARRDGTRRPPAAGCVPDDGPSAEPMRRVCRSSEYRGSGSPIGSRARRPEPPPRPPARAAPRRRRAAAGAAARPVPRAVRAASASGSVERAPPPDVRQQHQRGGVRFEHSRRARSGPRGSLARPRDGQHRRLPGPASSRTCRGPPHRVERRRGRPGCPAADRRRRPGRLLAAQADGHGGGADAAADAGHHRCAQRAHRLRLEVRHAGDGVPRRLGSVGPPCGPSAAPGPGGLAVGVGQGLVAGVDHQPPLLPHHGHAQPDPVRGAAAPPPAGGRRGGGRYAGHVRARARARRPCGRPPRGRA